MKKRSRGGGEDTLDAYLREVSRFPSLSLEEERDLAGRIRRHRDQQAFRRLVEANLRFVVGYAGQYRGLGVMLLDLIDEGNVGLMEAARRYDPEQDGKFITYAVWWIRQSILHTLAEQGRAFASPAVVSMAGRPEPRVRRRAIVDAALWQEMAEVFDEDGTDALPKTETEPAGRAGLAEGDETEFNGVVAGEGVGLDDRSVRDAIVGAVREAVHELPPREREVIRLRFGLDAEPLSLERIAEHLRLSRDRVRQIESRALGRLRRSNKPRELQCTLN